MTAAILEKINDLPEHLQDDVENYIDFLIQKQSKNTDKEKFQESTSEINWTDATLDAETDALVRDSIARRKVGDTGHLHYVSSLNEIFYDL
jgi:hypothetical protein